MSNNLTIYVSAGHSNTDSGAVNKRLNLREADLTRGLRNCVVEQLQQRGIPVRADGEGFENKDRNTAIKEAAVCDGLKIDLHFNASINTRACGVECFSDRADAFVAQKIAQAVATTLATPVRGEKGWRNNTESQHGEAGLAWLNRLQRSLLLEVCFISNDEEIQRYLANIERVAKVIADVLFRHNTPLSRPTP